MIKLNLIDKPAELTVEEEKRLVGEFKANKTPVWKKTYIIRALLKMSNSKCAYSEQALNTESAYMEVEHFKYKDKYKDEVVRWGNLLPACKKCNTTKGDWDVIVDPIVNPLVDEPKDFLFVKSFRFYKKNLKGQNTIEAVALNDREHFVIPRSEIGFQIADNLEAYLENLMLGANTPGKQRNIIGKIKNLLSECGPKHIYSAVLSTYVLYELETYKELKSYMEARGLWDSELMEIEKELSAIALPENL